MPTLSPPPILSVSELSELIRELVEDNLVSVRVRGELTNLSQPASGHWYFTLKDRRSQLRSLMFRMANRRVAFRPQNGQQLICSGRISLYCERGDLQLIVEEMEPEGLGSLQLAFEQLKQQLADEGLFSPAHKKPLPPHPQTIGLITSASGAAVHDLLSVLQRRASGLRILLFPVSVQGSDAPREICQALSAFNRHHQADVLIVGRGGGSLEDLQAFNTEAVARAIFSSQIPVISAVGHETDFTIADFVADLRAPTPSAAAELVVKNRLDVEQHLDQLNLRLWRAMEQQRQQMASRLAGLERRLQHPRQQLQWKRSQLQAAEHRLLSALSHQITDCQHRLALSCERLEAVSPLKTLRRGYALIERLAPQPQRIQQACMLRAGDRLAIRFQDGQVTATVEPELEPSRS
ncbi:MAG: exodeoxyribonuclease VII large subunit [Desulfuromonadaceae bacterium]|nr:exodeoxyribonuclease VII large subunit [Desulfuromonadaceae bacterium]